MSEFDGTYEQASERLDAIIGRLDSGQAELRETLELCAEAKTLIEFCAAELAAVDQGLKELRLEDLAASLAGPSADEPPPAPPSSGTGPDDPGPGEEPVPF